MTVFGFEDKDANKKFVFSNFKIRNEAAELYKVTHNKEVCLFNEHIINSTDEFKKITLKEKNEYKC